MNYSPPVFNTIQLQRQKRQFINNFYTQVSYIRNKCKPFLREFQKGRVIPLFTDKVLKFNGVIELQVVPFLEYDKYVIIDTIPKGKYSVFPAGEFKLFDADDKLEIFALTTPTAPRKIVVVADSFCVIETAIFNSISSILKTTPLGKTK